MNATSDFRTVYVLGFSLIGAVAGLAASWVLAVDPVTNLIV